MSTQTGIRADDKLNAFFGHCRSGRVRMFKVMIKKEALTLDASYEAQGTWEDDWDRMVLSSVDAGEPCYILYRLDEKDGATFRWIMISWSPDNSSIRNKMLYASTKATLKKEFGGGQIKDDLYGNSREDVSLDGYKRHRVSAAAPGPLSREEMEREEVKQAQSSAAVGVDTKHNAGLGGTALLFPMSNDLEFAVGEVLTKRVEYLQMSIDTKNEIVNLEDKIRGSAVPAAEVARRTPSDSPRYHLFVFRHTHEGDSLASTVFVYTMPGYNCSIKERMLYSSCKNGVVERLEQKGIVIEKKIEVDSADELTEEFIYSELHPIKNLNRPKFSKPAPPGRAGPRRLTKQPT